MELMDTITAHIKKYVYPVSVLVLIFAILFSVLIPALTDNSGEFSNEVLTGKSLKNTSSEQKEQRESELSEDVITFIENPYAIKFLECGHSTSIAGHSFQILRVSLDIPVLPPEALIL